MTKYAEGSRFRVTKAGARLSWYEPAIGGGQVGNGVPLAIGDVVESKGYRYSGGSDGITHPMFVLVEGKDGARTTIPAEFSPSSWGTPAVEWLETVQAAGDVAERVEAKRRARERATGV